MDASKEYHLDTSPHTIETFFEQLGLASSEAEIDQFIASHSPLDSSIALDQAPFWNPAQAAFIRDALAQDSDWAEVADELSTRLR